MKTPIEDAVCLADRFIDEFNGTEGFDDPAEVVAKLRDEIVLLRQVVVANAGGITYPPNVLPSADDGGADVFIIDPETGAPTRITN